MKILMVAPQPFFTPRGTPFSVLYRLRALAALGHEVDLATYHLGSDPGIDGVTVHRIPAVPWIRSIKIGPSPAKILLDGLLLLKVMWLALVERYDLIHTHEEAGLMGLFLAGVTGLPHVYDMHSSLPQQFGNFGAYNRGPVVRIFKAVETAILASADGVITICPDLAEHVSRSGYPGPHRLIENTFTDEPEKSVVSRRGGELSQQHGLAGKRVILYTGTFEAYQGLDLLVEAAAELQDLVDVQVVVVGGAPVQVADLRRQVEARGLAASFLLTGQVAPQEIPAWIGLATMLVSPRISGTNTPLKVYQYLKSGVPLVATRIHSHTQILDDSICLLTAPSAVGLAAGLRQLLASPEKAAALAAAGACRAREEYANDVYVGKVKALLEAVTGAPAASQAG